MPQSFVEGTFICLKLWRLASGDFLFSGVLYKLLLTYLLSDIHHQAHYLHSLYTAPTNKKAPLATALSFSLTKLMVEALATMKTNGERDKAAFSLRSQDTSISITVTAATPTDTHLHSSSLTCN